MVEGCGQSDWGDLGLTTTWGDGFRRQFDERAAQRGVSSAARFFDTLVDPQNPKPYRRNVILGPHVSPLHPLPTPLPLHFAGVWPRGLPPNPRIPGARAALALALMGGAGRADLPCQHHLHGDGGQAAVRCALLLLGGPADQGACG